MKYVHIVTDSSVMVLNSETGNQVKFYAGTSQYDRAVEMLQDGNPEDVFDLDAKSVVTKFFEFEADDDYGDVRVTIEDGEGFITLANYDDMKVSLHPAILARIMKMNEQGFSAQPLVNFIANLYANPSKSAVDELYLFIEQNELPITEDGCFIAYKIVQNDYKDIYSRTMSNKVGEIVSMPRHMVDDKRENTCSKGLHFCSKEYLNHYGSSTRTNDRCMLVKINPADVVSIPFDYNNAKGRTWQYEVVGEVSTGWRNTLPTTDYTSKAVVSNTGVEYDEDSCDDCDDSCGVPSLYEDEDEDQDDYKIYYQYGWNLHKNGQPFIGSSSEGTTDGYNDRKNKRANRCK
jgi:hypothetical protein